MPTCSCPRPGVLLLAAALALAPLAGSATSIVPEELLPRELTSERLVESVHVHLQRRELDQALAELQAAEHAGKGSDTVSVLKGVVYLARKDLPNARKSFEQALATKPGNARAMMGLAAVAGAQQQESEYVGWLQKAARADRSLQQPGLLLVNYWLQKRQPDKAVAVALDLSASFPDSVGVIDALAAAQLASGDNAAAARNYGRLVLLRPDDPQAQYKLGAALLGVDELKDAAAALQRALAQKPDFVEAKALLARVQTRAGKLDDALRLAREVQAALPRHALGHQIEGDALAARKDWSAAEAAYRRGYGIEPSGNLAVRLFAAAREAGHPKDGETVVRAWLDKHPKDVSTRAYLAATYLEGGARAQAIEQYRRIVELEPANAGVLNDLAWTYHLQKDARALPTAQQAYKVEPDQPMIADTLGWILLEQGRTAQAVDVLTRAVGLAPDVPLLRYHLGAALAKAGDTARARRELERALERNTPFAQRAEAERLLAQLPR
jgi:putative PEP-CTERM system TPR-repeat lipoprotein